MRRAVLLSTVLVCVLAGCGGESTSDASDVTLPPSQAPTSSEAPSELNERGNRVKALGEEAAFLHPDTGEATLAFAVDEIVVDIPCTADYSEPAENGHLIGLRMRASTGPDLSSFGGPFLFVDSDFRIIGPDGITHSAVSTVASYSCLAEAEKLTSNPLGPGQQYVGTLVLDSPTPTGVVVYAPPHLGGAGWEWQF